MTRTLRYRIAARSAHRIALGSLLACVFCLPLQAADETNSKKLQFGDAHEQDAIAAKARHIYDSAGPFVYTLLPTCPLGIAHAGPTDLTGALLQGSFARLTATTWTDRGRYMAEYYVEADSLIHVHESFEFFVTAEPPGALHNFKNLASWERRTYFRGGRVVFAESTGLGAPVPGTNGDELISAARAATELLAARRSFPARP